MEFLQWLFTFVIIFISFLVWLSHRWAIPEGYPPGPKAWPIVGHLPFMIKHGLNLPVVLRQMAKNYGPVIGLKVAWQHYIFINDYDTAHEAFVKKFELFAERPKFLFVLNELLSSDGAVRGIIFSNGDLWTKTRKYSQQALRAFGVGTKEIEDRIKDECDLICEAIDKEKRMDYVNFLPLITTALSNIMCTINFGHRFDYNDKEFKKILGIINHIHNIQFVSPVNIAPLLRYSPTSSWFWQLMEEKKTLLGFVGKQIQEHREHFNANEPRDFIDLYITKELEKSPDLPSVSDVKRAMVDLFIAGTDTTATAVLWFMLHLLHFPEIQKKCQEELDALCRAVTIKDLPNLPFTYAVLHETQRLASLSAVGITRSPNKATTLRGYAIPETSLVMPNIYAIHRDPEVWTNPEKFDPSRWLDKDGNFVMNNHFCLFGFAPRRCIGENLAKDQLFLVSCTLIQRFTVSAPDPTPPPIEGKQTILYAPHPFKICFTRRQ